MSGGFLKAISATCQFQFARRFTLVQPRSLKTSALCLTPVIAVLLSLSLSLNLPRVILAATLFRFTLGCLPFAKPCDFKEPECQSEKHRTTM